MKRLFSLFKLIILLTALMFLTWYLSSKLLPNEFLKSYFTHISNFNPITSGKFSFWGMFISNFVIGFLGIQFMNLFRIKKNPGGLFILVEFWIIYGLLLGTNSFILINEPVPFSISVLWQHTGFNELVAYTIGYAASANWSLWDQQGIWRSYRISDKKWEPTKEDIIYWFIGLAVLIVAMVREMMN